MLDLTPIRNHLEHKERLSALEEMRRLERRAVRNERAIMAVGIILGILAGWLAYLL